MKEIVFINLDLLSTLGWSEEKVNLNQILNRKWLKWKFMIIYPQHITAEQMVFSFEVFTCKNYFTLGWTFQNLEKNPKKLRPKHTILHNTQAGQ